MPIFEPRDDTRCLFTTVRNVSPSSKFFGFLPPHGRWLACGEEFTFWGDVQSWMQRLAIHPTQQESFMNCLKPTDGSDPVLALVSTPAQHYFDETRDRTQIVALDDNVLAAVDPCWGNYSSSSVVCP